MKISLLNLVLLNMSLNIIKDFEKNTIWVSIETLYTVSVVGQSNSVQTKCNLTNGSTVVTYLVGYKGDGGTRQRMLVVCGRRSSVCWIVHRWCIRTVVGRSKFCHRTSTCFHIAHLCGLYSKIGQFHIIRLSRKMYWNSDRTVIVVIRRSISMCGSVPRRSTATTP